jgi:parallel beta-helix repeat protein
MNKGIVVIHSQYCTIRPLKVSGSLGTDGAGIGIGYDDTSNILVEGGLVTNNRIGLTINAAHHNTIIGVDCSGNRDCNLSIDGVVTGSGDGGKFNIVNSCNCSGATATPLGGIYLGNGASNNLFSDCIANDNAGIGIRLTGSVTVGEVTTIVPNRYNQFNNCDASNNGLVTPTLGVGLYESYSEYTQVSNCTFIGNKLRGVHVIECKNMSINGSLLKDNLGTQFLIQGITDSAFDNCVFAGGDIGIELANVCSNNEIISCRFFGSAVKYIKFSSISLFRAINCNIPFRSGDYLDHRNHGDADFTLLSHSPHSILVTSSITADRTITLHTADAFTGETVTVSRAASSSGNFVVNVGSPAIVSLGPGEWSHLVYTGVAWALMQKGSL